MLKEQRGKHELMRVFDKNNAEAAYYNNVLQAATQWRRHKFQKVS